MCMPVRFYAPYLLCRRSQLSQAGCQVLGTLTQLHGCRLIRHRGNRWLGRGHHLTTRLQKGKEKNAFFKNKNGVFLQGIKDPPRKLNVAACNNKEHRFNKLCGGICKYPHSVASARKVQLRHSTQNCFFNCLLTPKRGYRPIFKGIPIWPKHYLYFVSAWFPM